MSDIPLIIDKIEEKNSFMQLAFFEQSTYERITSVEAWVPLKRILVDSEQKQFIYVIETQQGWEHIRFPLRVWKTIDQILVQDQDLMLVTSLNEEGEALKSILLKDFNREGKELVMNMRGNANYGEEMVDIVEEYFAQTIQSLP
jgi:hypothetical protein